MQDGHFMMKRNQFLLSSVFVSRNYDEWWNNEENEESLSQTKEHRRSVYQMVKVVEVEMDPRDAQLTSYPKGTKR